MLWEGTLFDQSHCTFGLQYNKVKGVAKRIYLIENDCTARHIVHEDLYQDGTDIIVCLNYLPFYELKARGMHDVLMPHDILDDDFYGYLHRRTDEISTRWFLGSDQSDLSFFEGISGGNIVSIMFDRNYLAGLTVIYTQIIKKLQVKYGNIESVIHDLSVDSNYFYYPNEGEKRLFNKKNLFEEGCRQLAIPVSYKKPTKPIPSEHIHADDAVSFNMRLIKKVVKHAVFRFVSLVSSVLVKNKYPSIYLDYSRNTSSLLYLSGKGVTLSVSNLPFHYLAHNLTKLFSMVNIIVVPRNKCFESGVSIGVDKLRETARLKRETPFYVINGIDYGYLYVPIINYLAENVIPGLRVYSRKVFDMMATYNVKKIILSDVRSEKSKTIIGCARLRKIETMFVDHGIQGHKHAKAVVHYKEPDVCVSPGTYKNYNIASHLFSLGNPSLDPFFVKKRGSVPKIRKILFLSFGDNHYGRYDRFVYQEKYYSIIFDAVKVLGNNGFFGCYYRSHNSNPKYNDYIFEFFSVSDHLSIDEGSSFESIIYDYDLVVSSVSTCFYQAICAGIPVIFVEPELIPHSLNKPFSGLMFDEVIRVSTTDQLVDIINRNIDDPAELNSYVSKFHQVHGEKYLGRFDELSSSLIYSELSRRC